MLSITELLSKSAREHASDIFITAGSPIITKIDGNLLPVDHTRLTPQDTEKILRELFEVAGQDSFTEFLRCGDSDLSFSMAGVGRFRINVFKQRNSLAAVIRVVHLTLEDPVKLGIPAPVLDLYKKTRGLILVTGPAGSGKTTTLASIVNLINERRNCHIVTLEDPIEYLHNHKMSIVNQREIEKDSESYAKALRAAMRQSPDVILVGEMRDLETMSIAITAAETGHLVLSSLHTIGAAKTIDRVIDVFPPSQQQQIRIQLATVLQAVISQQQLPSPTKGRKAVFEVMVVNSAIRNMIRESKVHQIDSAIYSGASLGMQTMDMSIAQAYLDGDVEKEDAMTYCINPDVLKKYIAAGQKG